MSTLRKDYAPLADSALDKMKADAALMTSSLMSYANRDLTLPAKTLYALVAEVIDSREEIFRLQLCETVDQIISEELENEDDEIDHLAFDWPHDYVFRDENDMLSGVFRPAVASSRTCRLPGDTEQREAGPEQEGQRLPRID